MKIAVTGALGLLGFQLHRQLSSRPETEVISTARPRSAMPSGILDLDITDRDAIHRFIDKHQPQVIISSAAMTQVDQCETERDVCWLNNVTSVGYLAEACEKRNVHLIHLSTDFIFDGTHGPLDETAVPNPVNFYGESKWASEKIVMQSSCPWTIIRTVLVYGKPAFPGRSNIVMWVKESLENKKPIKVVHDQWRTPTFVNDLATGCILAAEKKATGLYHISGEEMMTPYELAVRVAAHFRLDASLITPTDIHGFQQPAKRPPRTGFNITKAKKELGYKPHSFSEGLSLLG